MAKVVGDIAVKVGADITNLTVGLNQASSKVKGFGKDANSLGLSMADMASKATIAFGAITAGAAAIGAAAKYVVDFSTEITNLSNVAGVGVERFQSLSYAASQYGINQEKLADILKDTNDKFGDFIQTGAGPLADFFEQIAPKIGVTIDQFRKLNSADALQLYVSSLEKAGVNQKELTFYMEALASDATMLVPLLRDNAGEMRNLEQAAGDLGIVIDEDLIAKSTRMGRIWDSLMTQMQAKFVTFAATTMDGFDAIFGITEEGQIQVGMRNLDALVSERNNILKKIETETKIGENAVKQGGSFPQGTIDLLNAKLDAVEEEMNVENDAMLRLNDVIMKREEAKARIAELSAGGDTGGTGNDGGGGGAKSDKMQTELEALQRSLADKRDLVQQDYDEQLAALQTFLDAKKISQEEFDQLSLASKKEYTEKMAALDAAERQSKLSALGGMFSDLASLMSSNNDKLFKVGKAAAIANATIEGYQAAVDAWSKGMKIGGPPLAAAFTAASLLKTGSLIAGIASQNLNNGNASSSGAASAASTASAPTPPMQVSLNTFGGGEYVRTSDLGSILTQLNDIAGDRGYTILTPVSA